MASRSVAAMHRGLASPHHTFEPNSLTLIEGGLFRPCLPLCMFYGSMATLLPRRNFLSQGCSTCAPPRPEAKRRLFNVCKQGLSPTCLPPLTPHPIRPRPHLSYSGVEFLLRGGRQRRCGHCSGRLERAPGALIASGQA